MSSAGEHVTVTRRDDTIAVLEFFSPKANSLSSALLEDLISAVNSLDKAPDVRVILLQSVGKTFCAGASLGELDTLRDPAEAEEFFFRFARLILAIRDSSRIVAVRVHGNVVGGGVGIVAACDYAIASEEASVRLSELSRGIGPFVVAPAIERKMGIGALTALAFDTEWRSAAWAHERSLYSRVASAPELEGYVAAILKHLSGVDVRAAAELKRVLWTGTESWPALLRERAKISARLLCRGPETSNHG